jgi:hypothetical protein
MGSGGSFVAILLSIPLTAVALVGVVGVPKLQEILSNATSPDDDEFDEDGFSPRSRSKRGSSRSDRDKEDDAALWSDESDLKDEFSDELGSKKSPRSKSSLARSSKSKPVDDGFGSDLKEETDDLFSKPRTRFGQSPKETEATDMYATEPFKARSNPITRAEHVVPADTGRPNGRGGSDTFASGIEKLRSMGIERFHLEPGLGAGQYLFVCQVLAELPKADPERNTIHRFESEAADPAAAVSDVIKQVTEWQAETSVVKRTVEGPAEFRR